MQKLLISNPSTTHAQLRTLSTLKSILTNTHWHTHTLQQLKEKVSVQEHQFSSLLEHGRALLESMDPGTEAEQYMDGKLSTLDQRWTELVSQVFLILTCNIQRSKITESINP